MLSFQKAVVANRGAVPARIIGALRMLNVSSVAVLFDADADAPCLKMADEVFNLGHAACVGRLPESGGDPRHSATFESRRFTSWLRVPRRIASFARGVLEAGGRWIGPSPEWIDVMGDEARPKKSSPIRRGERMAQHEITAEVTGAIWKVVATVGDRVNEGEVLLLIESMKMEIPVLAEDPGIVLEILVQEGDSVTQGQPVARVEE